ncbi:MAG: hypothetical protein M1825_002249 [Sarcosagium campestre]|nr:MAG: hypothetical protein M1825_002249 [Sarcosagium campestre]
MRILINLLKHIDYSMYEVLPMAVTADVLLAVAVRPRDGEHGPVNFSLANMQSEKFEPRTFEIPPNGDIDIDASSHEWSNYFKSGLKGALSLLREQKNDESFVPASMDVIVDGTVPSGGGLSSSAAFVCASALAVMKVNGSKKIDRKDLVELAVVSERAVGVNSGGMDQAASVFSARGSALYVSFTPSLSARAIEIPRTEPDMTFVVAQSFVAADKHVSAPVCYNLRVVECSLAAEVMAKKIGLTRPLPKDEAPLGVSLRGLHDSYFEEREGISDNHKTPVPEFQEQLENLVKLTKEHLTQTQGYTREDVCDILGISSDDLNSRYMSKFPVRAESFLLQQRALHVFTEAIRVLKFMALLTSPFDDSEHLLKSMGSILNETQTSCREIYDCSCPEIDELCQLAREAGAYGSRLTGAGWGGCSVHLVPQDKVDAVKQAWERDYYRKHFPDISEEKLAEAVVINPPLEATVPTVQSFFTPINILLLSFVLYLSYRRLFPSTPATSGTGPNAATQPAPTVFKTYTPRTLLPLNGHKDATLNPTGMVCLAIRGKVYDVTPGRSFYGPGGPYANFAGRDASRGLACGSFDDDMLTEDLDGPLFPLDRLNEEEQEALNGWEDMFGGKYLCVGRLVAADDAVEDVVERGKEQGEQQQQQQQVGERDSKAI